MTVAQRKHKLAHIRWMIRRDQPLVLQIENASFDTPWTEEDLFRILRQRNCTGMVAELGEDVLGYMVYELHKHRLNLLNFAVAPDFRRMYVGTQMLNKLISKLYVHRRIAITTHVRESNLHAQLFFRSSKFLATKVIRNYYDDTNEDAYFMTYTYPNCDQQFSDDCSVCPA